MNERHPTTAVKFGDRRLPPHVWDKIIPTDDGCWIWIGLADLGGYGVLMLNKIRTKAHRIVYMLTVGDVPSGSIVCHSCDVRCCVNPSHLWTGSQLDNVADCKAKGRRRYRNASHCKRGHGFTPENTGYPHRINRNTHKVCRTCSREQNRRAKYAVSTCHEPETPTDDELEAMRLTMEKPNV